MCIYTGTDRQTDARQHSFIDPAPHTTCMRSVWSTDHHTFHCLIVGLLTLYKESVRSIRSLVLVVLGLALNS